MNGVTQPSQGARARRALGIVLVFVLLGPPVGGFVFMMATALVGLGKDADLAGLTWVALFALIYAVPLSYLAGTIPAMFAGLLIGVWQAYVGRTTVLHAACAGLLVGGAMLYLSGTRLTPDADASVIVLLAIGIVPTLVCWLVVRGWFFAHAAASGPKELAS